MPASGFNHWDIAAGKGNKPSPKRDWRSYNEELVVRGEFLLNVRPFKRWKRELKKANENKRGRPYLYPDSFVRWQAVWHQWVDYRGLEGIARALKAFHLIPRADDYTTAWHRISKMVPEIRLPSAKELEIAADGTGLKTGSADEYLTYRYGRPEKTKKHVLLVITVDGKRRKLLSADAYIEGRGHSEARTAVTMVAEVRERGKRIKRFYGDGAYDASLVFSSLRDAENAVKIRTNATTYRSRGSKRRRDEVRRYRSLGYKRWKEQTGYGRRWAVEGFFLAMKRKFGEDASSRKPQTFTVEAVQRAWAYDEMACYAGARTRKGEARESTRKSTA